MKDLTRIEKPFGLLKPKTQQRLLDHLSVAPRPRF
jgi:hypothetical protein